MALLVGMGYGAREVARRLGVSDSAVFGFCRRIRQRVCTDEQLDGRRTYHVVMCWAARNLETLSEQIRAERAADWRELPPAITEARVGVA